MESKSLQRAILLTSGICAVVVILLSQAFFSNGYVSKHKTGKADNKTEVTIHAPSDLAAQGSAVELDNAQTEIVLAPVLANDENEKAVFIQKIASPFFKTLFRVIISPNAP